MSITVQELLIFNDPGKKFEVIAIPNWDKKYRGKTKKQKEMSDLGINLRLINKDKL